MREGGTSTDTAPIELLTIIILFIAPQEPSTRSSCMIISTMKERCLSDWLSLIGKEAIYVLYDHYPDHHLCLLLLLPNPHLPTETRYVHTQHLEWIQIVIKIPLKSPLSLSAIGNYTYYIPMLVIFISRNVQFVHEAFDRSFSYCHQSAVAPAGKRYPDECNYGSNQGV